MRSGFYGLRCISTASCVVVPGTRWLHLRYLSCLIAAQCHPVFVFLLQDSQKSPLISPLLPVLPWVASPSLNAYFLLTPHSLQPRSPGCLTRASFSGSMDLAKLPPSMASTFLLPRLIKQILSLPTLMFNNTSF